jgi:hypothetical protein
MPELYGVPTRKKKRGFPTARLTCMQYCSYILLSEHHIFLTEGCIFSGACSKELLAIAKK